MKSKAFFGHFKAGPIMTSESPLWRGSRRHMPSEKPDSAVLLLHGLGSNADDLIGLAPALAEELPTTAFISPNAPHPCDMAPFGRQWFSLRDWSADSLWLGVQQAATPLRQMIEDVKSEFSLPTSRLALVGFSQGCMISLHVAPRLDEPLAAVVGMSGALIGEDFLAAQVKSRPPVLLTHGQMDPIVPYAAMPAAASVLSDNGFSVETISRPLMAHNVDDEVIMGASDFLARHLRGRA